MTSLKATLGLLAATLLAVFLPAGTAEATHYGHHRSYHHHTAYIVRPVHHHVRPVFVHRHHHHVARVVHYKPVRVHHHHVRHHHHRRHHVKWAPVIYKAGLPGKCGQFFYWEKSTRKCKDARWK